MVLGCTAAFSAAEDGTPQLPFDSTTGKVIPELWQRWLNWDPVRMVARYDAALRGLHTIWIDAGTRDEWFLDLGATAFRAELLAAGVAPERIAFELFDATHMAIDYRYPVALEHLARAMSNAVAGV